MKVLKQGNQYTLINGVSDIRESLDPGIYAVAFSRQSGFKLNKAELKPLPDKVYGRQEVCCGKVFSRYETCGGNLGVLMSGAPGLGKSLLLRRIGYEAVSRGLPVVLVREYFPQLPEFIADAEQPIVWLFDEFDKLYGVADEDKDTPQYDTQARLLMLLDGTSATRHIFAFTCNELDRLNDYFFDRPGRIYYHFRFSRPDKETVCEYFKNTLRAEYLQAALEGVDSLATVGEFNYDSLRALAEELNAGYDLKESLQDLNIDCRPAAPVYTVVMHMEDGYDLRGIIHSGCVMDFEYGCDLFLRVAPLPGASPEVQKYQNKTMCDYQFRLKDLSYDRETGRFVGAPEDLPPAQCYDDMLGYQIGDRLRFTKLEVTVGSDRQVTEDQQFYHKLFYR